MKQIQAYVEEYVFIPYGEVIRGAIVAAVAEVGQVVVHTDLNAVTDWKSWTISLGAAAINAAIHFAFGKVPAS